jgi:hypothetical protein
MKILRNKSENSLFAEVTRRPNKATPEAVIALALKKFVNG